MATQQDVADHLDLSTRRVYALIKDGILPPSKGPGGQDLDACRVAYIRHLRGVASGQVRKDENLDLEKERARLASRQAEKHELQIAKIRGQLIPADEVNLAWQKVVAAARNKLLSIPTRAAARIKGTRTTAETQKILSDLVNETLVEIHDDVLRIS